MDVRFAPERSGGAPPPRAVRLAASIEPEPRLLFADENLERAAPLLPHYPRQYAAALERGLAHTLYDEARYAAGRTPPSLAPLVADLHALAPRTQTRVVRALLRRVKPGSNAHLRDGTTLPTLVAIADAARRLAPEARATLEIAAIPDAGGVPCALTRAHLREALGRRVDALSAASRERLAARALEELARDPARRPGMLEEPRAFASLSAAERTLLFERARAPRRGFADVARFGAIAHLLRREERRDVERGFRAAVKAYETADAADRGTIESEVDRLLPHVDAFEPFERLRMVRAALASPSARLRGRAVAAVAPHARILPRSLQDHLVSLALVNPAHGDEGAAAPSLHALATRRRESLRPILALLERGGVDDARRRDTLHRALDLRMTEDPDEARAYRLLALPRDPSAAPYASRVRAEAVANGRAARILKELAWGADIATNEDHLRFFAHLPHLSPAARAAFTTRFLATVHTALDRLRAVSPDRPSAGRAATLRAYDRVARCLAPLVANMPRSDAATNAEIARALERFAPRAIEADLRRAERSAAPVASAEKAPRANAPLLSALHRALPDLQTWPDDAWRALRDAVERKRA